MAHSISISGAGCNRVQRRDHRSRQIEFGRDEVLPEMRAKGRAGDYKRYHPEPLALDPAAAAKLWTITERIALKGGMRLP
jgi:hypothetical protein